MAAVAAPDHADAPTEIACACGQRYLIDLRDFARAARWHGCPLCEAGDAFACKVIPRQAMFALLVPTLIAAFFALAHDWIFGMAILIGTSAIDALLFWKLPLMWVCYACQSELRGLPAAVAQSQKPFDHHTAERYRLRKFLLKR